MAEQHEDPERLPDGVPHIVVGLTAACAVVLAIVLVLAWSHERISVIVLAAVVTPVLVSKLVQKSERERDHVHPSR
ncbi:MAG TPA: hypothetical protein VFV99_26610 [Kofleriaceae bacterium]|nr:hypothetical protein [Kofleriaceae bacterium]